MSNYIIFNNKDSRDIRGLLISELPPISRASMRVKETVIDGVDGSIIEELGYESYDKTVIIGLKIGADVDKVAEFFTGNGEIVFSNEPERYYIGRVIKGIDFERMLRYRVAKVTFRVQPFKYNRVEVARQATFSLPSGDEAIECKMIVDNIGNHTAKPIITIKGAGVPWLWINGKAVCGYSFIEGVEGVSQDEFMNYKGTVVIDCEKQDVYWEGELKNRHFQGEFPVLEKGSNVILIENYAIAGAVESIKIEKYSRWL